jgi:membrane protein DedA with SNARE-associated domain
VASLGQIALQLIEKFGYLGLGFGLVVDSAGVPIPSEVLLPISGVLVRQGHFNFLAVLVVSTLAQTLGAVLAYMLGARGGLPLVRRFGRYVLFSERELATTQKWFARYGSLLTLFGRCLPVIRTYIGYPAGIAQMPFGPFVVFSLIGSLAWSAILVGAGYALGGHLDGLDAVLHKFSLVIAGLLVVLVVWYVVRHLRHRNRKK